MVHHISTNNNNCPYNKEVNLSFQEPSLSFQLKAHFLYLSLSVKFSGIHKSMNTFVSKHSHLMKEVKLI